MALRIHGVALAVLLQLSVCYVQGIDQICSWNINKDYPQMLSEAVELTPDFRTAKQLFEYSGFQAFQKTAASIMRRRDGEGISRQARKLLSLRSDTIMKRSFSMLFNMLQHDTYEFYMRNGAFAAAKKSEDDVCPLKELETWRTEVIYETLQKLQCTDEPVLLQEVQSTKEKVKPLMDKLKGRSFWAEAKGGEYGMLTYLPSLDSGGRGLEPIPLQKVANLFPDMDDREASLTSSPEDTKASRIADVGGGAVMYTLTQHQPSKKKILLVNVRLGSTEYDPKDMTTPEELEPVDDDSTASGETPEKEDDKERDSSHNRDGKTGGISISMGLEDRIRVVVKPAVRRNQARHLKPKAIDKNIITQMKEAVAKAMEQGVDGAIVCGDFGNDISGIDMRDFTSSRSKDGKISRWEDAAGLTPAQRSARRRWTNLRISYSKPKSVHSRDYPSEHILPLVGTDRKYLKWTSMTIDKTVDTHCYVVESLLEGKSQFGDIIEIEKESFQQYNPTWYYIRNIDGEPLEYANREELEILPVSGPLTWSSWMQWLGSFPSTSALVRFKYNII